MADAASSVTSEHYARAERFLSWNKDRYVLNADIQHRWIGQEDRFSYLRTNAAGEKEFVVVDAATGNVTPAFDHGKVAAALSKLTGKKVSAGRLPFASFRFRDGGRAIEFQHDEKVATCQLETGTCAAAASPAGNESRSPDGKWAAFLKDHNIWVRSVSDGARFQLTQDGVEHYGYAVAAGLGGHSVSDAREGKPIPPQVRWSPDSRFLLTHRLDDRKVKDLHLLQSVPEDGTMRPKLHTYRYAMAGDEHLHMLEPVVLDVTKRRAVKLATPAMVSLALTLTEKRDAWWSADSKTLYFISRDRHSRSLSLNKADPVTGAVTEILQETGKSVVATNATNPLDFPVVRALTTGDVIWYSNRDGWGHLYYYGAAGKLRNQITKGDWLVRGIVGLDETQQKIYFTASGREPGRDPYEQRIYSVRFDGSGLELLTPEEANHEPNLLSLSSPEDKFASSAELAEKNALSPSGRYLVASYSRPDVPPVLVLRSSEGRVIKELERADISKLRANGYTPVEPFEVLAADGKTALYGNLYRPSHFDPKQKYPVIDSVYPGPQIIRTKKSFTPALFDTFEAQSLAELGFIVITIDGRGTPHRSKAFLDYSYGRMGKASDFEDHIAGIRQLAERYPYIDITRVGVEGASGGGFATARALLGHGDFYKVGVSAEGNHEQRAYSASWGEIYNGPVGEGDYEGSSTVPLAGNLKGKLLLMHGEMDDNVHPALTLKLIDALIKANKDFDLIILPNENHAAFVSSTYFMRRKWDYFVRHLLGQEPPAGYSIERPQEEAEER